MLFQEIGVLVDVADDFKFFVAARPRKKPAVIELNYRAVRLNPVLIGLAAVHLHHAVKQPQP